MQDSRTANATRNIIWGILNKCVMLIIPFIIRTIIIKTLGADYLGLSSLFTSILQVLNLTEMGFSSAVVFCLYKPIAENNKETISALITFYKRIYRIIGFVILGVGIMLCPFLPYLIEGSWPADINIYILYIIYLLNTAVSYLLFSYKSVLLLAYQRNDIEVKITTGTYLVQYAAQIISLYLVRNFYVYAIIFLVFTIIGNLLRAYITDKRFPQYVHPTGRLTSAQKKDIKKRVAGAFIQKICATTRNSLDSIVLSMFLGLTTITIYGNYYYILTAVHGMLTVIVTGITAGVGDSIAQEDVYKNHQDMKKFSFVYAWLSGWCTICMLCLYQPFMKLWVGEELMFPLSAPILFCIYFYSLTVGDIRSTYVTGAGLWWEGRWRSLAETATNIILNLVLGYFWGVNGIIVATIISIVLINFLWGTTILYKYYFKGIKPTSYYLDNLKYIVVTIVIAMIAFKCSELIHIDGLLGLIIILIVVTIISNTLYLLIFYRNAYFKDALQMAKRIVRRR